MRVKAVMVYASIAISIGSGRLRGEEIATGPARADIEAIVRDYIMQHPEVLIESVQAYRSRERVEAQRRSKEAVALNQRELFDDPASPVAGKAAAPKAIVQFFDYKCGYCRRVSSALSTLLEEHNDVRVIYKELPILGPESHMASRAALAAGKQGAYLAFHRELMSLNGPLTPEALEETGKKLGLDVARLKLDMSSKEVVAMLEQNQRLASAIGVQSTPSFVIGGELVSGAIDLARFKELISKGKN